MAEVTLIIPCYNAADTIAGTIESAIAQTVPVRIIVVDDCSTDNSFEVVAALAEQHPQIKLFRQAVNGGPGKARNTGLRLAETVWVAGLDSDDFLEPERMERLLAHVAGREVDFLMDDIIRIWPGQRVDDGVRVWRDGPVGTVAMDLAAFVRENTLKHTGFRREIGYLKPLMRTAFLRKHGLEFREDMRLAEDYEFYARALVAGARLEVVDPCGYIALNREGSLSKAVPTKAMEKVVAADRALLATPGISTAARAALREHLTQSQIDLQWMRLIDSVRARSLPRAFGVLMTRPAVAAGVILRLVKHALKIPIYPEERGKMAAA
ncbi:glycosyltransferase family 2 protein [Hyphomonas sp.]|jgi:succinoglycan biosynthesis protein ExoU|uniref:glycosyltransferase family 2 protein n=1 Tax=Hyphomonas sp. TaxID=87 RepID=UPI0025BC85F3|nr:glycosyltransferase family 2 protein [Hyphomonas sp.]